MSRQSSPPQSPSTALVNSGPVGRGAARVHGQHDVGRWPRGPGARDRSCRRSGRSDPAVDVQHHAGIAWRLRRKSGGNRTRRLDVEPAAVNRESSLLHAGGWTAVEVRLGVRGDCLRGSGVEIDLHQLSRRPGGLGEEDGMRGAPVRGKALQLHAAGVRDEPEAAAVGMDGAQEELPSVGADEHDAALGRSTTARTPGQEV